MPRQPRIDIPGLLQHVIVRGIERTQLEELDHFPWSGHSVIMGKRNMEGQSTDSVLGLFGKRLKTARENYHQFVADGLAMGNRPELVGAKKPGV